MIPQSQSVTRPIRIISSPICILLLALQCNQNVASGQLHPHQPLLLAGPQPVPLTLVHATTSIHNDQHHQINERQQPRQLPQHHLASPYTPGPFRPPMSPVAHHLLGPAAIQHHQPSTWITFHQHHQNAPSLMVPNGVDYVTIAHHQQARTKPKLSRRRQVANQTPASSISKTKVNRHPQSPFAFDADNRNATTTVGVRRGPSQKKLVCYYGTWAVYRPDAGKYPVENIDPHLCTHVIYGFTGLSYDNTIKPLDPWNDLEDNYGKGAMRRFTNLKRLNPDLKTLVAIGGWNEGSIKYSRMAAEPGARAKFVDSCVKFIAKYDFDGLDLDWEYPGSRGGTSNDKQNFVKLLREMKQAFEPHGYLLTAAVSAGLAFAQPAYEIAQVSKYLDLINLMAYDYHGGWETKAGINAPLFSSPRHDLSREDRQLNVNWSVNYWLAQGAPAEKIMLGVGSYGRSFTLDKESQNGINAPASQKGRAGPYTREPGSLGYNEICESMQQNPQSWTIVRDPDYMTPYAYSGRLWVGYDDRESLALKAQYAKSMGLGGMMMWSIETDDFHGKCHGEKYPLLNTIKRVMNGQGGVVVRPTPKPAPKPKPTSTTTTSTTSPRPPVWSTSTTTPKPDHEVEGDSSSPRPPLPISPSTTRRPPFRPTSTKRPNQPRPPKPSKRPNPTTSTSTSTTPATITSTSTTTTVSPAVVTPGRDFVCRADGMFADPQNCRKFIRCVSQFGSYAMYRFDCAPGTAFNEQQQLCDHLYNVPSCRKY